jgi:ribose 5-phosphate isomerase B
MKLSIGCDHAGFEMKEKIKSHLEQKGITLTDRGTHSIESTDYPDYAHKVAEDVETKKGDLGILLCGSANGVCMTANKHNGVRAAICWNKEIAALARQHNNANIICIPSRFIDEKAAMEMIEIFMKTEFEGGRHEKRVNKIDV